ncbi:hypothetical protein C6501_18680 [Candidatus Poribacteria bacterium]|nr:MAG: hypothetical protein C6501_18680 [Candidatus Poribacteria bacterium]
MLIKNNRRNHFMKHTLFILTLITFLMISSLANSFAQDASSPERMVRMIYFLPNDRVYHPEVVQNMQDMIRRLQTFFADQMEAHGHGRKTFRFETNNNGEPKVHRVDGLHSNEYYFDNGGYWQEVYQEFDISYVEANNVYFLVWDNGKGYINYDSGTVASGGIAGSGKKDGGELTIPTRFDFGLAAHELGHAFGLQHDFRDDKYIMSYGWQNQLSACAAKYLAVHPYFNSNVPVEIGPGPTIELMSSRSYPAGAESVTIRLKVSDPDGVYQVLLFGPDGLIACRGLKGEKEAIVEFEYEGYNFSGDPVSLSVAVSHSIHVKALDTNGDEGYIKFILAEIAQHHIIHTFGNHKSGVHSLAFSPDGKKIASGGWGTSELWDVATQRNIATFKGSPVAFSPNGRILATGGLYNINLWDAATQQNIATLQFHSWNQVYALAFSPDGKMLASGGHDGSITLWDVATQRDIFTFQAHLGEGNKHVLSLVFSPDGKMLASGSYERMIKLWDVATWTNIRSFRDLTPSGIYSLAFSPDGKILASTRSSWIKLWDVAAERDIAVFGRHMSSVYSVAFSPDGKILASGSSDGTVNLRNVSTGTKIVDLSHNSEAWSVAFSPDGTTLASGTSDGTVNLWDVTSFLSQESVDDTKKIAISEIMVASNEGQLPQWIELYNRSFTHPVNLKGWRLEIQNYNSENFNGDQNNITIVFGEKSIKPQGTFLIVSKQGRSSEHFRDEQIYNLNAQKPNLQGIMLSEEGFYMRLWKVVNEAGIIAARIRIDEVGNLDGKKYTNDKPAWSPPKSVTKDGVRASMIRRQDKGTPLPGTQASGWISAINTRLATSTTYYYGHPHDIGAPGVGSGQALPVTLSRFRADRIESGVVLKWTTESELDNAGFYIYRSQTKDGKFKVVNSTMIQGAGTTGKRTGYQWTDTTAKPNTVYYYRIEDVSHAGVREQLATVRLRGLVSAAGKLTIRWADVKSSR